MFARAICPICQRSPVVTADALIGKHNNARGVRCSGIGSPALRPVRPIRDRIAVWKNKVTGSWRVDIGDRTGYYCRTWDEAMQRADELAQGQRMQALMRERHGDGSRP